MINKKARGGFERESNIKLGADNTLAIFVVLFVDLVNLVEKFEVRGL